MAAPRARLVPCAAPARCRPRAPAEMAAFPAETKVYVGNLGTGAGKGELERAFSYYGPLRTVWIARNPPGFAFVEFEDPRDAEDAVLGLDGKYVCAETPWLLCQQHLTFSCSCQQYQLL